VAACGKDLAFPYGRHRANEQGVDGSPYPFGECTDFCWRYYRGQGVQLAPHMGDAKSWKTAAGGQGYTIYDTPKVGTVACWDDAGYPPFGHVAIITGADPAGFSVQEMNFCFDVATDPGHVDERQVTAKDPKPIGFILPTGAALGPGTASLESINLNPLGDLAGIGAAITNLGLQAEADLATLRQRIMSGGQIALGTTLALTGGGVIALSALGHDPGQLARSGIGRARRGARTRALPAIQRQFPESTPSPDKALGPAGVPRPRRITAARATRTLALPTGGG
jgi:surface antigen